MSGLGRESKNETEPFVMSQPASRILLVGGDLQWAGKLSSLLAAAGLTPAAARGAGEALQLIQQHPVELVLVDWESPEGPELLRQLKERPPADITLVIALTGADDTAAKLSAF
jgi:CheY-like chemotaxis protein